MPFYITVAGDETVEAMVNSMNNMNSNSMDAGMGLNLPMSSTDESICQARNSVYEQDFRKRLKTSQREHRHNMKEINIGILEEGRFLQKVQRCGSDESPLSRRLLGDRVHVLKPLRKVRTAHDDKAKPLVRPSTNYSQGGRFGTKAGFVTGRCTYTSSVSNSNSNSNSNSSSSSRLGCHVHEMLRPKTPFEVRNERLWTALKPYECAIRLDTSNQDWFISRVNSTIEHANEKLYGELAAEKLFKEHVVTLPPIDDPFTVLAPL